MCPNRFRTNSCYELSVQICRGLLACLVTRRRLASYVMPSGAPEIDVAFLWISTDELGANFVAHIETLAALRKQALDVRLKDAHECAAISDASHDRVKDFADTVLHRYRCQALRHLPFYLARSILFHRAIGSYGGEFLIGVGALLRSQRGFDQALTDQIGKSPVGSGGMGIVLDREAEVPGSSVAGTFEYIFSRTDQFDHTEREIGKVIRVGRFAPQQKLVQGLGVGLCGKLFAFGRGEFHDAIP